MPFVHVYDADLHLSVFLVMSGSRGGEKQTMLCDTCSLRTRQRES